MNLYVPCFDEFQAFIDRIVANNPNDSQVAELQSIVENGYKGQGVHQLSADGSNVGDDDVFSVVQLHDTSFSYPEGFFDNFILVVTMNFYHTKMDVFCDLATDPEEVYKDLQKSMLEKTGVQI